MVGKGKQTVQTKQASVKQKAHTCTLYKHLWTPLPSPPPTNLVKLLPSIGWILTLPKLHLATYKTSSTILCILYGSNLQNKVGKLTLATSGVEQVMMSRSIVTTYSCRRIWSKQHNQTNNRKNSGELLGTLMLIKEMSVFCGVTFQTFWPSPSPVEL